MKTLTKLSNKVLVAEIKVLSKREHATTVALLLHIGELERRKLYLDLGYASVFAYLREELRYSSPAASRRLTAARFISKYPKAKELLEAKDISLSTIAKFAGIVTEKNIDEVLEAVSGRTKDEVDRYVCFYRPKKEVREYIKPIVVKPTPQEPATPVEMPLLHNPCSKSSSAAELEIEPQLEVESETPKQFFDVKFLADEEFMNSFKEVERLLSGKLPTGLQPKELFAELMAFYLKHKCPKQKQRRVERQDRTKSLISSKNVSAQDRRKALLVSGQRCEYVSDDGTRCSCTWDLEVDHIQSRGMGGGNAPENLRVLCRAHNLMFAERYFGIR